MNSSRLTMTLCTSILVSLASLFTSMARADLAEGKNALLVNFGVTPGGAALGLDFENGFNRTFGLGGYFRIDPDDQTNHRNGITTIGGFIRPHFSRQQWDLYVSPGFGIVFLKPGDGSSTQTLLGPSWAIGLLYEFTGAVSFGLESMNYYSWLGKDAYRGELQNDLMAKFRFIF